MKDVREIFDPKPVAGEDGGSTKERTSRNNNNNIGNDVVRPNGFKVRGSSSGSSSAAAKQQLCGVG